MKIAYEVSHKLFSLKTKKKFTGFTGVVLSLWILLKHEK